MYLHLHDTHNATLSMQFTCNQKYTCTMLYYMTAYACYRIHEMVTLSNTTHGRVKRKIITLQKNKVAYFKVDIFKK